VTKEGTPQPAGVRYDRLVELLPKLEAREPCDVLRVCYDAGIVFAFDWPSWARRARRYLEPGGLERARLETCRKILTIVVRQDRFVDGALADAIATGLLARIVRRIADLTGRGRP
jgi:hypothetical protein